MSSNGNENNQQGQDQNKSRNQPKKGNSNNQRNTRPNQGDTKPNQGSTRPNQPKRNNNYGSGSSRGGGGGSGGGNRRAPQPVHNHKVDMKKYEKMIGAAHANFSDICMGKGEVDECTICCKPSDLFGIGTCRHPVCVECAVRIRVLSDQKTCPVCRSDIEVLFLTFASSGLSTVPLKFPLSGHPDENRYSIRFENEQAGMRYEKYLAHVCKICKTAEGDRLEFPSFISLRQHMANMHQLSYCHICTDNLNLFSRERKTFTRDALQRHIRYGDSDDKSQKGHPSCLFCDQRFFDQEGQYRHLRKDHFFCQFCEADGTMTNVFFGKHEELLGHYKEKHYLCEVPDCRAMGIAFSNPFDYKMHTSREHSDKKKMALDFSFSDRQLVSGSSRSRREAQDALPQRRDRISVVPQQPAPPPPEERSVVVVASAQSRNPIRYNRGAGPTFVPQQQDFPSLGGGRPATGPPAPVVVVPSEFPRLKKTGRPNSAAVAEKAKKKQPAAAPVDDFPSLGGARAAAPAPAPAAAQQQANWAKHSDRFEMIDDDERMGSHSSGRVGSASTQPASSRAQAPTTSGQQKQKPKSAPAKPVQPVDDFPSLPLPGPSSRVVPTARWASKAAGGAKCAITGVKMPNKKKALPVPELWPERKVTTPASEYKPPDETWEEIPVTKKPTKKERKEMQRRLEEAAAKHTVEQQEKLKVAMMQAPDGDLQMQAVLMKDIESTTGTGNNNKESSPDGEKSSVFMADATTKTAVEAATHGKAPVRETQKKEATKDVPKTENGNEKKGDSTITNTKKQPAVAEKKKVVQNNKSDFPALPSPKPVEVVEKKSPSPSIEEPEETGLSSWLSSVTSMFNGLSLSNVLGDTSGPLADKGYTMAKKTNQNPSTPAAKKTSVSSAAPPGLSPPSSQSAATVTLPATGTLPATPVLYSAPPGFENVTVVQPPPGLGAKPAAAPPAQLFSMAPFLSAADTEKRKEAAVTMPDPEGWVTGGRRK